MRRRFQSSAGKPKAKKEKVILPPPAIVLGDFDQMSIVLPGAPRTKKNGSVIGRTKEGRPFILPSEEWQAYEKDCLARLQEFIAENHTYFAINYPVSVQALFYREARYRSDLHGYQQGLADLLQVAGILADDALIDSWDGSRKLWDKTNPRVEIVIRRYGAAQEVLPL